ncbi:hypothetical protein [Croceicoccus marinus]|uniref:Uncharacterized protein n=1 Tax=Croceicoccus marinus TaxID=450378 RepID=A0A7G6W1E2_9SPHN|nr:hypothetical protein [Croceicoccus marinus]QNE07807.1 hypothetical protein H4O24_19900 [Croceicoccus marinus]
MLTDSERFAFTAHRIHAFETTGNAYDAVQTDEAIGTGDTLLIFGEAVVGVALTWPFAVTAECGHLHQVAPKTDDTLDAFAASLGVEHAAIERAAELARRLGLAIDPTLAPLLAR